MNPKTLEELRDYWDCTSPDFKFRKYMLEAIDLAIAKKIKNEEIFHTAMSEYKKVYGKQTVTLHQRNLGIK